MSEVSLARHGSLALLLLRMRFDRGSPISLGIERNDHPRTINHLKLHDEFPVIPVLPKTSTCNDVLLIAPSRFAASRAERGTLVPV